MTMFDPDTPDIDKKLQEIEDEEMKDNHTLPTDEGLQGNEKMETAIAALQQEATEEEVKGSGSVMSTFLADMHQLFTRHFLWMKS